MEQNGKMQRTLPLSMAFPFSFGRFASEDKKRLLLFGFHTTALFRAEQLPGLNHSVK